MKIFGLLFCLMFCLLPVIAPAQEPPGLLEQIIRGKQDTARIYYIDSILPVHQFGSTMRWGKTIKSFPVYGLGANSIQLSRRERKHIFYETSITHWPFVWMDNLFKNSQRIPKDSAGAYLKAFERKNHPYDSKNGYQFWHFSKPVYLRDNTICLVSFVYMCGGLCGEDEVAFYKKNENGRWERFVVLRAGVF